jgi:hypothetical protein
VDVIDTTTNTVLVQLAATPPFAGATPSNNNAGPDGVIVVNHREVWAGDGPSQVKVIDLFSQKYSRDFYGRSQVYVPIPSTAGGAVCSNAGGSDVQGCIAVFTAAHDDQ